VSPKRTRVPEGTKFAEGVRFGGARRTSESERRGGAPLFVVAEDSLTANAGELVPLGRGTDEALVYQGVVFFTWEGFRCAIQQKYVAFPAWWKP